MRILLELPFNFDYRLATTRVVREALDNRAADIESGLPACVLPDKYHKRLFRNEEKARAQWPEPLLQRLTLSMPDTPANQQACPQPRTQKRVLGFPLLRVVVVLALAMAVLTGAALGPCVGKQQGEPALLRTLLDQLQLGAVQTLNESREQLIIADTTERARLAAALFVVIVRHRVGDRPDRCEPRAVRESQRVGSLFGQCHSEKTPDASSGPHSSHSSAGYRGHS